MKKMAAGYVRVSTEGQATEGESLNTQRKDIEAWAEFRKYDIYQIYQDAGRSGGKIEYRDALKSLLSDANDRKFQAVVVPRLSRFGRNARELLNNVEELKQAGVSFYSVKEGLDFSNAYGKAMLTMLAAIAELERETIREQMTENKLARWKTGRAFIGQPPYGYFWNKDAKKIEVNEAEKAIYLDIVQMYSELGKSMKDIAVALNDRGIKAKRRPFTSTTVSEILKNPAYYGNYVVNKYIYKDGPRGAGTRRTDELKPTSEWITVEVEQLISKTEWDQIQQKTTFNKVKSKRASYDQRLYWLRDLLYCGECGSVVKPHHGSTRKDGSFPRYYSCYFSTASPKTLKLAGRHCKCPLPHIRAEKFEQQIWLELLRPYVFQRGKPGIVPTAPAELIDNDRYERLITETNDQIKALQSELKRLETARKNAFDLLADDRFDKDELAGRLARNREDTLTVESKIRDGQRRLTEIQAARKNDELYKRFMKDQKATLRRIGEDLLKLDPDSKKRLAEGMITGGKITIRKAYPDDTELNLDFDFRPNILILKELMEQGKIGLFNQNSPHDSAAPYL